MSKIYVTRNENQLVFSTKPVQYDSEFKTTLSRPAFLAFARWLKQNVQEEDLKSEIVIYGFLNRYKHDLREDRVRWLRCIKSIKDEDLYRELGLKRAASHCPSVQDRDFAFEIPVYYIEDFYQLLLLMGYDEEKAAAGDNGKYSIEEVQKNVIRALKQVFDPEIPVNVYDLGLIYEVKVGEDRSVFIKMTMTSPTCPMADDVVNDVNNAVSDAPGVKSVQIELTFEPEWDESRMSEEARLELGLM